MIYSGEGLLKTTSIPLLPFAERPRHHDGHHPQYPTNATEPNHFPTQTPRQTTKPSSLLSESHVVNF